MRLLLVEDDTELAAGIAADLRREGFAVDVVSNGIDAEYLGREQIFDAVILDLGLPGKPGLEVLKAWRDAGLPTPVLILTARDAWSERVLGLRSGADDYLGKPFHFEELLARLQSLLRRSTGRASAELLVGGLRLDEERQRVCREDGVEIELTGTEFRLLRYLMTHTDRVLSKSRLTEHVYEGDQDRDSNVLEVYIRRLRDKIGRERIETRRGQGYLYRSKS
ncbi:MAG: response regulator transcription factor [Gammaproteobacteria bacterium]|nr:response regulator transcription factor [Gammaproteobacteria bacterium]MCP5318266.1 response regulator transcription factor [Chromatiaceae bacterium]MCW5584523.1 response regulator transcription factor [Chromatiales bacterium]MCB1817432.1 response regulator transcription factor [Gammaproteobacteria bacterium]MCP5430589.1 response regulator transcription factor [Chromatiaceae bacterium]